MNSKYKKFISLFLFFIAFLTVVLCFNKSSKSYHFSNGIEVVFREVPNSHVATVLVAVKAGSILETEDTRGLAFLVSKCLYQRSQNFTDIQKYIDSYGIKYKSDIMPDFCRYSFTFSELFLDSVISMVSDVVRHPIVDHEILKNTREHLTFESLHQVETPQVYLEKVFLKHAFHVHPYRFYPNPEIEDIKKLNLPDVQHFIDQAYIPKNICIVIAGPRKSKRAVNQLRSSLASWNKSQTKTYSSQEEPIQSEPQMIKFNHDLNTDFAFVAVGWKAPGILNQDTYVMDIIVAALGMGESSRLNKQIRNKIPSVYYIWAEYMTPREPGFFVIYALCDPEAAMLVEEKIKKEIDILKSDSMTSIERQRANTLLKTQEAFHWEHTMRTAQYIGYWTIMKDYSFALTYVENLNAVTSDDIQQVARTYFQDSRSTSIVLLPKIKETLY